MLLVQTLATAACDVSADQTLWLLVCQHNQLFVTGSGFTHRTTGARILCKCILSFQ